jgi:hypothetical protein
MRRSETGWTYRNGAGGVAGIVSIGIKITSGSPGLVKVTVEGSNGRYAVPRNQLPVTLTLVIDTAHVGAGECAQAVFSAGSPAPMCGFHHAGAILRCR